MSHVDVHATVLDHRPVRFHRHHARRPDDLSGPDVELPLMEVALDDVALDEPLGQRARAVRSGIVGDAEVAVEVVHGENEAAGFDAAHFPRRHIVGSAQFDALPRGGHSTGS